MMLNNINTKKEEIESDTSTEVISLSDWMQESTMFNIITNIQFFKNYVISNLFLIKYYLINNYRFIIIAIINNLNINYKINLAIK